MKKLYYSLLLFAVFGIVWISEGSVVHEVLGVAMGAFILIHMLLNSAWFGSLWKGTGNSRRTWMMIVNALFFLCMVGTIVTGAIYSEVLFSSFSFHQGARVYKKIHEAFAFATAGCLVLHSWLHKEILFMYVKRLRERFSKS